MDCRSRKVLWLLVVVLVLVVIVVAILIPAGAGSGSGVKGGKSRPDTHNTHKHIATKPTTQSYYYPSSIPARKTWGCDCYVKGRTAVCTYKLKDDRIPSCVNSSVTAVFIRSKEVDRLAGDAFRHVPRLEFINITDTKLKSLSKDLFRHTRGLKRLLVQKNPNLRYLENDLFRNASKLEDVILDRNNISSLDRGVFTHLLNVKKLNLAYNNIGSLPKEIFRGNKKLEELGLSGNPLRISSDTARDLLRNNADLRVLVMRDCKLEALPTGLLRNASNLEWLDLSHNKISKFPPEFVKDCPKLSYLRLSYNKLQVLGSDLFYLLGGSLATLELDGNPWRCDCDLVPLAGWTTLRRDVVRGRPRCSSAHYPAHLVANKTLQHWFHSKLAEKCGVATSSLRRDLNRVLAVARAIARDGPSFFTYLLPTSNGEVGFTATYYFSYAMTVRTDADIDNVVRLWERFLVRVLGRRYPRHRETFAEMGIDPTFLDWSMLNYNNIGKNPRGFNFRSSTDAPTTTTTKTSVGRATKRLLRPKGWEPLVNFTYVMKNVPENLTKVVDDGIEEELKIIFPGSKGAKAARPNTTATNARGTNSTGLNTSTVVPPKKLNATEQLVVGLRSELREVLSTLLASIDRAKRDAAIQEKEDKKTPKLRKSPHFRKPRDTRIADSSSESCVLIPPVLTVFVAFLTLLADSLP